MKLYTAENIRAIDKYTIQNKPILSIDLMENAANACTNWILQRFSPETTFYIFCGQGNNGGDGFVIARQLYLNGYEVFVFFYSTNFSPDAKINFERFKDLSPNSCFELKNEEEFPKFKENSIVIDAIFGSGLNRTPDGLAKKIIQHINESASTVISIDIPSGMFCDFPPDAGNWSIIKSNYTLTFEFSKYSFLFPESETFTGKIIILPIGLLSANSSEIPHKTIYLTREDILPKLNSRKRFSHKGTFGHALLVSGSLGKMGATVLASRACMRAGAGLLTVHAPEIGYTILQTSIPEAMCVLDNERDEISNFEIHSNCSAIGIGPGLGNTKCTRQMLETFLKKEFIQPIVLDADALNILSENKDLLFKLPNNTILTPHLKEFERLAGFSSNSYERLKKACEFSKTYSIILVLKGHNTLITIPNGDYYFNSTGNSGMATAGSGDVLTGIILSLLAQKYTPEAAAILGVYLHGLAGDLAAADMGQEALIAGDIVDNIGNAYQLIKNEDYEINIR